MSASLWGGNDDEYSLLTPYPPPSLLLSTPNRQVDDCVEEEVLIEGVEVEVEAEEVAEYVGVGKNN